jgi:hypothetical protein
MENTKKHKIYSDYKELPFYNYSRIMHTGDFLYMVKGYDFGDELDVDPLDMQIRFDEIVRDFVMNSNSSSEEIHQHAQYIISTIEFSKIILIIGVLELVTKVTEKLSELGEPNPDDKALFDDLFKDVIIQRSDNTEKQLKILYQKKSFHENNISKYKEILEKEKENKNDEKQNDIDKIFINVCLGLEISPPDKRSISLYDFYNMTESAVEKMKAIDKINTK